MAKTQDNEPKPQNLRPETTTKQVITEFTSQRVESSVQGKPRQAQTDNYSDKNDITTTDGNDHCNDNHNDG